MRFYEGKSLKFPI
jgi:hypothetical protein